MTVLMFFTSLNPLLANSDLLIKFFPYCKQVGHIRVGSFIARTHRDVTNAVRDLSQSGARHLVLDLRDNRGGLVQEGVEVARLFLDGLRFLRSSFRALEDLGFHSIWRSVALHFAFIEVFDPVSSGWHRIALHSVQASTSVSLLMGICHVKRSSPVASQVTRRS